MYVAGLLSVKLKILGAPIVIPNEGATFFKEFTNSLVTASSLQNKTLLTPALPMDETYLLLKTTAHLLQLPTLKLFHFLKHVPQSALSS